MQIPSDALDIEKTPANIIFAGVLKIRINA